MAALVCLIVFVSLIYFAFLPFSAKNKIELKQLFILSSIALLILGVIGHILDKTNNDDFILGIFIFTLLVICITGSIKALALKEPDYPSVIIAYCFLMYGVSNAFVIFLSWANIIIEAPKLTGG